MTGTPNNTRSRRRERTIAVTWGPWGGIGATGKSGLIWRLCLGFVAITYVPAEMTQILDTWLRFEEATDLLERLSKWDVLNMPPGAGDDGPYWQSEIAKVLNPPLPG